MKVPKIDKAVFEPKMDCQINSALIRKICQAMKIKYDWKKQCFKSKEYEALGADVTDWHHDHEEEPEPHYDLRIGIGDYTSLKERVYCVEYCDYHSVGKKKKTKVDGKTKTITEGKIILAPGEWKIRLWLPKTVSKKKAKKIAQKISDAYAKAMADALPDYFILDSKKVKRIK